MRSALRRAIAPLAAGLALLMGVATAAPAAQAQEQGGVRYVALGDSFTAGPRYDPINPCLSHPAAWPIQVAERWGLGGDWANGSCSGVVVDGPEADLAGSHLDRLINQGALGPRTELVTLQFGGNERYGGAFRTAAWSVGMCLADLINGCDVAHDPGAVRPETVNADEFIHRLTRGGSGDMIGRIRVNAPRARIALVGYPTILPSGPVSCLPVVGTDSLGPQPRTAYAHDVLDRIEESQRGAAARLGVDFISLRPVTEGHDICRPVGQRWVTQAGDFHEELLPFHPTVAGYTAHAAVVNDYRVRALG